jgi:hypothetical protein
VRGTCVGVYLEGGMYTEIIEMNHEYASLESELDNLSFS